MTDLSEAKGRAISAARMLADLDQTQLAILAGVSPSTISNLERGSDVRPATLKSVRRALKSEGITMAIDTVNGRILVAANFDYEEQDED